MKYLLIGQPNAGKSSIYNKLTDAQNIIHRVEGTTRDWHSSRIKGLNYSIITGPKMSDFDKRTGDH